MTVRYNPETQSYFDFTDEGAVPYTGEVSWGPDQNGEMVPTAAPSQGAQSLVDQIFPDSSIFRYGSELTEGLGPTGQFTNQAVRDFVLQDLASKNGIGVDTLLQKLAPAFKANPQLINSWSTGFGPGYLPNEYISNQLASIAGLPQAYSSDAITRAQQRINEFSNRPENGDPGGPSLAQGLGMFLALSGAGGALTGAFGAEAAGAGAGGAMDSGIGLNGWLDYLGSQAGGSALGGSALAEEMAQLGITGGGSVWDSGFSFPGLEGMSGYDLGGNLSTYGNQSNTFQEILKGLGIGNGSGIGGSGIGVGDILKAGANYLFNNQAADRARGMMNQVMDRGDALKQPERAPFQALANDLLQNPQNYMANNPFATSLADRFKNYVIPSQVAKSGNPSLILDQTGSAFANAIAGNYNNLAQILMGYGGYNQGPGNTAAGAALGSQALGSQNEAYRGFGSLLEKGFPDIFANTKGGTNTQGVFGSNKVFS